MVNEDWEITKRVKEADTETNFKVTRSGIELKQNNDIIILENSEIIVLKQAIEKYEELD